MSLKCIQEKGFEYVTPLLYCKSCHAWQLKNTVFYDLMAPVGQDLRPGSAGWEWPGPSGGRHQVAAEAAALALAGVALVSAQASPGGRSSRVPLGFLTARWPQATWITDTGCGPSTIPAAQVAALFCHILLVSRAFTVSHTFQGKEYRPPNLPPPATHTPHLSMGRAKVT